MDAKHNDKFDLPASHSQFSNIWPFCSSNSHWLYFAQLSHTQTWTILWAKHSVYRLLLHLDCALCTPYWSRTSVQAQHSSWHDWLTLGVCTNWLSVHSNTGKQTRHTMHHFVYAWSVVWLQCTSFKNNITGRKQTTITNCAKDGNQKIFDFEARLVLCFPFMVLLNDRNNSKPRNLITTPKISNTAMKRIVRNSFTSSKDICHHVSLCCWVSRYRSPPVAKACSTTSAANWTGFRGLFNSLLDTLIAFSCKWTTWGSAWSDQAICCCQKCMLSFQKFLAGNCVQQLHDLMC